MALTAVLLRANAALAGLSDEQIAAIEAEANEYKLQLAEYDTAKIESAKEQEKLLNSERQVQELERKKLIKEYEDRLSAVNADLRLVK